MTITGTNFTNATAVQFGSTNATSFSVNNDSSITAASPAGSGSVDVTVTTLGGTSATSSADQFTFTDIPTLTLTSTASSTTQVGQSYSQTNIAGGGTAPYTYSLLAGILPAGTTLSASTGTVSGTPTTAGAFSYTIKVTDSGSPTPQTATQVVSGTITPATLFIQQGSKLVGTGVVGTYADQGKSVAVSADGNTAIVGGPNDNGSIGAVWVFTRSGGVWTQQGSKLVGTGGAAPVSQGWSVAVSADGNTAIVGGPTDNSYSGAAWVVTRSGGMWTQQGSKLVGTGVVGYASQGFSVALSGDGNTAVVGGLGDNGDIGAAWVFVQPPIVNSTTTDIGTSLNPSAFGQSITFTANVMASGGTPTGAVTFYDGAILLGNGTLSGGTANFSLSSLSIGDHTITATYGGDANFNTSTSAPLTQTVNALPPNTLAVIPATNISTSGHQGGPFAPSSFQYQLSTSSGSANYSISGVPTWLDVSSASGTVTTAATTVTFSVNSNANGLSLGTYIATIGFTNTTNGQGTQTRSAVLTVNSGGGGGGPPIGSSKRRRRI